MSLELDGRHVVECLVNAPTFEPVDVVECRPLNVLDVAPRSLSVERLGLEETVERFGESMVMGITL